MGAKFLESGACIYYHERGDFHMMITSNYLIS